MKVKASVVVPVKNGGALLERVLQAVQSQQTPWPFELLVIDSGSKDQSLAVCNRLSVRVHQIAPENFGHGRTRNLGAELTIGEFIVFITQDALPEDDNWLFELVKAADSDPSCAGAFGRHRAYPGASPVTERELAEHFRGFGEQMNLVRLDDLQAYQNDQGLRQYLHFFSSNNACVRRAVWRRFPLPDVDFAEDQLWAKTVIEAGYSKAYAPGACVYHSHDFGVMETYRRAFDESRALCRLFGYRLVPSAKHYWVHTYRLLRRNAGWVAGSGLPRFQRWKWLLRMPGPTLARMGGFYLGGKQARLPAWLHNALSRDKALQRS